MINSVQAPTVTSGLRKDIRSRLSALPRERARRHMNRNNKAGRGEGVRVHRTPQRPIVTGMKGRQAAF